MDRAEILTGITQKEADAEVRVYASYVTLGASSSPGRRGIREARRRRERPNAPLPHGNASPCPRKCVRFYFQCFFSPDPDNDRVADKKAHAKIDVGSLID